MATPYWSLTFDVDGVITTGVPGTLDEAGLTAALTADGTTDLVVMSHGWNNSITAAQQLYDGLFPLVEAAPGCPAGIRFLGVFWPSIWFPDPTPATVPAAVAAVPAADEPVAAPQPGAADAAVTGAAIAASLTTSMPQHADALRQMGTLIDTGLAQVDAGTGTTDSHQGAVATFHQLFTSVFQRTDIAVEDSGQSPLFTTTDPQAAFAKLSQEMGSAPPAGDIQGLGDIFGTVWNGAKDALRVGSYLQMKGRAGDIGQKGLGALLTRLHAALPGLRVHLVGHSFGARLVSYSLSGIGSADASPVASLTLLQGAFSHWAFTPQANVPFDKPGALCDYTDRVHGPLVATFTAADWALGNWYPKASILSQQDVEDTTKPGRWDGMGHDGFAATTPTEDLTLPLPAGVSLTPGTFYRADANAVINNTAQSAFAGAHSDLLHPEVGALVVAAATATSA